MFGSTKGAMGAKTEDTSEERFVKLESLLDRGNEIPSISALSRAIRGKIPSVALADTAIGIDTNVFLRLGKHPKSSDILDYLTVKHDAPLILPGQAVQEFWNNTLSAVGTISKGLEAKVKQLQKEVATLKDDFSEYKERFEGVIQDFSNDYSHVLHDNTIGEISSVVEAFEKKAFLSYVPRSRFINIAAARKSTKTPPGFEDSGYGDFFVWAEFLNGLIVSRDSGRNFTHTVMVTDDQKRDWSRGKIPHPILTAEISALTDCTFELWSLEDLADAVEKAMNTNSN